MDLNSLFLTVFFNMHALLTLFALVMGSFAIGVFFYQSWLEQRRKYHGHDSNDFAVFDE